MRGGRLPASEPDWSPDGRSLTFVRWPDGEHTDVWTVRADGTSLRRVTTTGHAFAPAWRPDGGAIVFSDHGVATLVAPDGSGLGRVPGTRAALYCSGFAWSPDGRRLAAACGVPGLFVVDADGGNLRVLDAGSSGAPSWSPDGAWLVYSVKLELRLVRAAGGAPVTLDLRGATGSAPDWSPR